MREALSKRYGLPHARGGVSRPAPALASLGASSPRPWGCFLRCSSAAHRSLVFPTPVGVFPWCTGCRALDAGLPHARGGVSKGTAQPAMASASSPRPWGCFRSMRIASEVREVFPTPVGVFLFGLFPGARSQGLPHARGGVSDERQASRVRHGSSPRPWGCFRSVENLDDAVVVFPTPVGVFPPQRPPAAPGFGLPHARGGVSSGRARHCPLEQSSPRPWGCFRRIRLHAPTAAVFPTPVGVFLAMCGSGTVTRGLPHARGGVSQTRRHGSAWSPSSPRPWGCFRVAVD